MRGCSRTGLRARSAREPGCPSARPLGQCCRCSRQHCTGLALRGSPARSLGAVWRGRTAHVAKSRVAARRAARAQATAGTARRDAVKFVAHGGSAEALPGVRRASPVQCCRQYRQHWPSGRPKDTGTPRSGHCKRPAWRSDPLVSYPSVAYVYAILHGARTWPARISSPDRST